jgi:hypothetical protein
VADTPSKLLSKLHQLSGSTVITEQGTTKVLSKLSKCEAIAYDADKRGLKKFVVFYNYVEECKLLHLYLSERFKGYTLTTCESEFKDADKAIFIGQVTSKREGIDLSSADVLYFYSMNHSATTYLQARSRVLNMNKKRASECVFVLSDLVVRRGRKSIAIDRDIYDCVVLKNKNFSSSYYV